MEITPLPPVDRVIKQYEEPAGDFSSVALIINSVRAEAVIAQRDNQAYTSLIEGIKKEEVEEGEALYSDDPDKKMSQGYTDGYNQALNDIIEKVVKPLYNKE